MTKSHKKKRRIRKFKSWRLHHKVFYCLICGKKLKQENHHLLCNNCHKKRHTREISGSIGRIPIPNDEDRGNFTKFSEIEP